MEFFAIANVSCSEEWLQQNLTLERMGEACDSVYVHEVNGDRAWIDTIWGEFEAARQVIKGGVRFSLTTCPNALAWTLTTGYPPAPEQVVIHGTINRTDHDAEFIESIEEFLEEWRTGLERLANHR